MTSKQFIEAVYEIAFGDDAINKGYSKEEVLERLNYYSKEALKFEDFKYDLSEDELDRLNSDEEE